MSAPIDLAYALKYVFNGLSGHVAPGNTVHERAQQRIVAKAGLRLFVQGKLPQSIRCTID
jgi:hypothetical protein